MTTDSSNVGIDPKVFSKIKKCLALATSDNANEAATALRQAHALMAKHGVTSEAITMSDIGECSTPSRTMARNKPAQWEASLASIVGRAFGCQMMVSRLVPKKGAPKGGPRTFNEGSYIFVGLKCQVEIAAYTAQVLVRKCQKARTNWIAEKLDGMSKLPKGRGLVTRLGNEFAMGWVAQIAQLVHDFALSQEVTAAIGKYIERSVTEGGGDSFNTARGEHSDELALRARSAGWHAAKGEHLHRPMKAAQAPLQLEMGA